MEHGAHTGVGGKGENIVAHPGKAVGPFRMKSVEKGGQRRREAGKTELWHARRPCARGLKKKKRARKLPFLR